MKHPNRNTPKGTKVRVINNIQQNSIKGLYNSIHTIESSNGATYCRLEISRLNAPNWKGSKYYSIYFTNLEIVEDNLYPID